MSHPVRLQRRVNMTLRDRLEQFVLSHAWFFLALSIVLLLVLFIVICVSMCGISATESGAIYNGMNKVI